MSDAPSPPPAPGMDNLDMDAPDMDAIKAGMKATWSAGNYGTIADHIEAGAMDFMSRIPVEADSDVLDVACGTGQIAFPAWEAGARVTGVDIAPNLIEQAREKAKAAGADIRFDEGDAEELPYQDASFDLTLSLIGAMFAPRPELVAAELIRVTRPGGRIVMGNWTPDGFVGHMFKTVSRYMPPPAGVPAPVLWGREDTAKQRLRHGTRGITCTERMYPFHFPFPPSEVVEEFARWFGPVKQALAKLDEDGQAGLKADLETLWSDANTATDGTTRVDGGILEVQAIRA